MIGYFTSHRYPQIVSHHSWQSTETSTPLAPATASGAFTGGRNCFRRRPPHRRSLQEAGCSTRCHWRRCMRARERSGQGPGFGTVAMATRRQARQREAESQEAAANHRAWRKWGRGRGARAHGGRHARGSRRHGVVLGGGH
jgi:hypothetical protein